jgi:hypothetical protein
MRSIDPQEETARKANATAQRRNAEKGRRLEKPDLDLDRICLPAYPTRDASDDVSDRQGSVEFPFADYP